MARNKVFLIFIFALFLCLTLSFTVFAKTTIPKDDICFSGLYDICNNRYVEDEHKSFIGSIVCENDDLTQSIVVYYINDNNVLGVKLSEYANNLNITCSFTEYIGFDILPDKVYFVLLNDIVFSNYDEFTSDLNSRASNLRGLIMLDNSLQELSTQYDDLLKRFGQLTKDYRDLQHQYNNLNLEFNTCLDDLLEIEQLYNDTLTAYNGLVVNMGLLQSEFDELIVEYDSLEVLYQEKITAYNDLNMVHNLTVKQYTELNKEHNELRDNYTDLNGSYNLLNEKYEVLLNNKESLQNRYDELLLAKNELGEKYRELNTEHTFLQEDYDTLLVNSAESYNYGYNKGLEESGFLTNGMITIFNSPMYVLGEIFNFEILGINILSIIKFLLTVGIFGFVLKKIRS